MASYYNESFVQEFKNDGASELELEGIISSSNAPIVTVTNPEIYKMEFKNDDAPKLELQERIISPSDAPITTLANQEIYKRGIQVHSNLPTWIYHWIPNMEQVEDPDLELEDIKLYKAILRGDWETAKDIFNKNENALTGKIDEIGLTPLHVATMRCKDIGFVEKLLKEINPESLTTMVNKFDSTALHYAALAGNIEAVRMLVDKNKHLLFKKDIGGDLPIHAAVFISQRNTLDYLFKVCKHHIRLSEEEGYQNPFKGETGAKLLAYVIRQGTVEVALQLLDDFPDIVTSTCIGFPSPIECMAENVDLYYSGTRYNFLQNFLYSHIPSDTSVNKYRRSGFDTVIQCIFIRFWNIISLLVPHMKHLKEDKVKHNKSVTILERLCEGVKIKRRCDIPEQYVKAIHLAVENNIPEAAEAILKYFPQIVWRQDVNKPFIMSAIINRNEKVYNSLLHGKGIIINGSMHRFIADINGNNLGHFAGKMAPIHKLNLVSGAALQMQRELQWFQEVHEFLPPTYKEAKNNDNQTPIEVFRTQHMELRKEGEEWMKKTADSYTITAALIITIAFAGAITVPGGINGDSGKAIFETKPWFIIFVASDAVSLFTSTTSLLLFLSILTARYSEDDFLYKLPRTLIIGLVMLFLSVTSMVIAFSAALFILVGYGKGWILIPVSALACLPITSFVTLQFPLLYDLISSTYGPGIFDIQKDERRRNFPRSCTYGNIYSFFKKEE